MDQHLHGYDPNLRLAVVVLEREVQALKLENTALKNALETTLVTEKVQKKPRMYSKETSDKWKFYHEHKEKVAEQIPNAHWSTIKKATDAEFYKHIRNTP
jgi:regulator of replication initiation timing